MIQRSANKPLEHAVAKVQSNGIEIEYEEFGSPDAPVLLLVMGLGMQLLAWPKPFCELLVAAGFRVIRFDNRDVGLSSKIEGGKTPSMLRMILSLLFGWKFKQPPYTLDDMTADTVGLLDALGIRQAHIVGASMGGMIVQTLAARYPERVLSLTSIMSTSGDRKASAMEFRDLRKIFLRPQPPANATRDQVVEHMATTAEYVGSAAHLREVSHLRAMLSESFDRGYYPDGFMRQTCAIVAHGSRRDLLRQIKAPTLVIHGKRDILVPPGGGLDTAVHIHGARLELVDDMGHDLPPALWPLISDLVSQHCQRSVAPAVAPEAAASASAV
jgi:pimeloyl-ACP methyl ester carboxylesterase